MYSCIYAIFLIFVLQSCSKKLAEKAPESQKIQENKMAVGTSKIKIKNLLKSSVYYRAAKEEDFTQLYEITDEDSLKIGQSSYGFHATGDFKSVSVLVREILESLITVASSDPASEPSFGSKNAIFILFDQKKQFQSILEVFDDDNDCGVIFDNIGYQIPGKNDLFMAVATSYDDPRILRSGCSKEIFTKILKEMM